MDSVSNWRLMPHVGVGGVYGLKSENGIADFFMQGIVNQAILEQNVSVLDNVHFSIDPSTYFVIRFKSDIDPTFGQRFAISVTVFGFTQEGKSLSVDVVPPTAYLTNQTWITYRTNIGVMETQIGLKSISAISISIDDFTYSNELHSFYIDYLGFVDEPILDLPIILISVAFVTFCTVGLVLSVRKISILAE
jgi:hypothetical protein